jgi:(p)ppGpp synthase/HD superfamily hydrolase
METKENRQTFMDRLKKCTNNQTETDMIMFAYDVSKEAHRTHKRDSGERYFEHPREGVLIMLDELNWYDCNAIISFLLHDVGEDSSLFGNVESDYDLFVKTAKSRLSSMFSEEISELVILLTKPEVDGKRFTSKLETFQFYTNEMSCSPKATLLKMVDRLHNLRSIGSLKYERKLKIVNETIAVYLPLFEKIKTDPLYGAYAAQLLKEIASISYSISLVNSSRSVVCQKWEESEYEEGWGVSVRPDGYSLHLSLGDAEKFIKKYWDGMPNATPDCYDRPSGTPYSCSVDEKTFEEVKQSTDNGKFGKRFPGEHPIGGKDGWLREEERKALGS